MYTRGKNRGDESRIYNLGQPGSPGCFVIIDFLIIYLLLGIFYLLNVFRCAPHFLIQTFNHVHWSLSVLLLLFDVQIRLSSCRGRGNSVVSVPSSRDIHLSLSALL